MAALIQAAAGGDRAAFRRLYESRAARLHGIALRITRQTALAADAVHDAFVQVWQQADRFDAERGSADAWLTALVRYRALDIIRRTTRETTGLEIPEESDPGPGPLDQLMASSEGAALGRCLAELPEDRRKLVVDAFVQGLSHAELAARDAMPLGTVKSWIRRALASLKSCLQS